MVDLLGHLGYLEKAMDLLCTMPAMPDVIGWKSLLTGCKAYGNADLGNHCFNRLSELVPNDASRYTIMSNIYVDAQSWEETSSPDTLALEYAHER
mgnify:FL=1